MIIYPGAEHALTEDEILSAQNFRPSPEVRELMDQLNAALGGTDIDLFQLWKNIMKDPDCIMTKASERDAIMRRGFQLCGENLDERLPDFDAFMEVISENPDVMAIATVEGYLRYENII